MNSHSVAASGRLFSAKFLTCEYGTDAQNGTETQSGTETHNGTETQSGTETQ